MCLSWYMYNVLTAAGCGLGTNVHLYVHVLQSAWRQQLLSHVYMSEQTSHNHHSYRVKGRRRLNCFQQQMCHSTSTWLSLIHTHARTHTQTRLHTQRGSTWLFVGRSNKPTDYYTNMLAEIQQHQHGKKITSLSNCGCSICTQNLYMYIHVPTLASMHPSRVDKTTPNSCPCVVIGSVLWYVHKL